MNRLRKKCRRGKVREGRNVTLMDEWGREERGSTFGEEAKRRDNILQILT